jgi:hypothetical protein
MTYKKIQALASKYEGKLSTAAHFSEQQWSDINAMYQHKLKAITSAIDDATNFLEVLGKRLPPKGQEEVAERVRRLDKIASILQHDQTDDILHGIKPSVDPTVYESDEG